MFKKLESQTQAEIQIGAVQFSCILQRNNSGSLIDSTGRPVRYGLGNVSKAHNERIKSSDLIGITIVTITPDMVGKKIGVYTAIEAKREGWVQSLNDKREAAQQAYIDWVKKHFGLAGFATNVEQLRKILGK